MSLVHRAPSAAPRRGTTRSAAAATRLRLLAAGLFVLGGLVAPIAAAGSGERVSAATSGTAKDEDDSLRYDSFSAFNCSASSFTVDAIAHLNVHGPASIEGTTTLNGVPYDSYFADLGTGPDSFTTNFGRDFALPGKPPGPGTSTYTFQFNTLVKSGTRHIGRTVTRIRCTDGALLAASEFTPDQPYSVPVGGPGAIAGLGLAIALVAAARLGRSRT